MITTSSSWKDYVKDTSVFHIKATMTGGSTLNLTDEDFMFGSVSFTDSMSGMTEIALGAVVTNSFNAILNNNSHKFDNWDWDEIEVWFGIVYEDETEEWIHRGIYTIDRPSSVGATVKIEAYDYMDKLNKYFAGLSATLTYPVDSNDLVDAICGYCNVTYSLVSDLSTFNVDEFEIDESTTCRQVLMWVLQTDGLYARIDPVDNELQCKKWGITSWGSSDNINGGVLDAWNTVDSPNGGTISPWAVVTDVNGGGFFDDGIYSLEKVKQQTIMLDDIQVTGIRAYAYNTVDEFAFDTAGSDGYIIALQDNPLITEDNVTAIATRAWANVSGLKVRPFDASLFGDPSIEAGDMIILHDLHTDSYIATVITNLTYSLLGDMRVSCDAEPPEVRQMETANPVTSTIKGATMAAYDYVTARKISASYISAGTMTGAVEATNFTMSGGAIDITTDDATFNMIKLNYSDNGMSTRTFLKGNSISVDDVNDNIHLNILASPTSPVGVNIALYNSPPNPYTAFQAALDDNGNGRIVLLNEELKDFVTEYGTSGNWTYRKWHSGIKECWYRETKSSVGFSSWGVGYSTAQMTVANYPVTFTAYPSVQMTAQVAGGAGWILPNHSDYSLSNPGSLYVASLTSGSRDLTINIYAKGV